jgi:hypothetical protein
VLPRLFELVMAGGEVGPVQLASSSTKSTTRKAHVEHLEGESACP